MAAPTNEQILTSFQELEDFVVAELASRNIVIQVETDPTQGAGYAAPVSIFLFNPVSQKRYEKIGPANTDWRQVGSGSGGGVIFDATIRTANFTITEANRGFFIDTTDNPVTATLDDALQLVAGQTRFAFIDIKGTYATNGFTFDAAPIKIERDVTGIYTSDVANERVTFIYSGADNGLMVENIVP